jgi:hypothetical protein
MGLLLMPGFAGDVGVSPTYRTAVSPDATVVKWDFAQWCQIGRERFTLEKTTLTDVMRAFGGGRITRDGHEGDANFNWLVRYRWRNQIVTFSSNNEMGSDTNDLEGIEIGPANEVSDASKLPVIYGPITLPIGVPGMSFRSLQRILGYAQLKSGYAEYQYLGDKGIKSSDGKTGDFNVQGWLRVKIVGEKVQHITLGHLTSS